MTQITSVTGAWPWSVNLEDGQEPHPNLAQPEPGPKLPYPCTGRDTGSCNGPHPPADLHPHKLHSLFIKHPGSKRPMTRLGSPFLYLNISKHLAKTFIFPLPQGEKVIRENGTNMPICQKQRGRELKGTLYQLSEQAEVTQENTRGPACLPIGLASFSRVCN